MSLHLSEPRWFSWIAIAVIVLYGLVLILGLFMPAYVDDILYPMTSARAGYDGWYSVHSFAQCGSTFQTAIPSTLLPGRTLSWLLHTITNSFFAIRIITILILLAWVCYAAWIIKVCFAPDQPLLYIFAGITGVAGLGTLPFTMLLSRPETAMIFAITFYVSLPFLIDKYAKPSPLALGLTALLFFLVTSWFAAAHPKGLFYAPLLLISAFQIGRWHKKIGYFLSGVTIITLYEAWQNFWRFKIICPGSKGATRFLENAALSPTQFITNPPNFLSQFKHNILNGDDYINGILFRDRSWLPVAPHSILQDMANPLIIFIILCTSLNIILGMTVMLNHAFKHQSWKHPSVLISCCLLCACMAQWAIQSQKAFYNFTLIWISLILCGLVTSVYISTQTAYWKKTWFRYSCLSVWLVAILSQCVLLLVYVPANLSALEQATPNGIIQSGWRLKLLSPLHYTQREQHILDVAKSCNIAVDQSSSHVAVDVLTYTPLKSTYQPSRLDFSLHEFDQPRELFAFLHKWQSSGLITQCRILPDAIKPYTIQNDGICCLSKEQIDHFH